jgi:hypothetical protein
MDETGIRELPFVMSSLHFCFLFGHGFIGCEKLKSSSLVTGHGFTGCGKTPIWPLF